MNGHPDDVTQTIADLKKSQDTLRSRLAAMEESLRQVRGTLRGTTTLLARDEDGVVSVTTMQSLARARPA